MPSFVHSLASLSCQRVKDKDKSKDKDKCKDKDKWQRQMKRQRRCLGTHWLPRPINIWWKWTYPGSPITLARSIWTWTLVIDFWSVSNLTVFRSGLERWSGNSLGTIFFKVCIKWNPFQHNDIFDGSSAQGCKGSGRGTAKAVADSILQFPIHWGAVYLKATCIHPENQVGGFSPVETRVRERRK